MINWIFKPNFWIMLYDYDKRADDYLLNIINDKTERDKFADLYFANIMFSEKTILIPFNKESNTFLWLSNYPYAYATIGNNGSDTVRGSRDTIYKFKKFIDNIEHEYPEYFL